MCIGKCILKDLTWFYKKKAQFINRSYFFYIVRILYRVIVSLNENYIEDALFNIGIHFILHSITMVESENIFPSTYYVNIEKFSQGWKKNERENSSLNEWTLQEIAK